ncbi:MAG: aspartate--tRNA ligase [Bdellovibrionota bacterium]
MSTTTTDLLDGWHRTHKGGELRSSDVGKEVILFGWAQSARDHGGIVFIDLRDRWGVTQIVCDPAHSKGAHGKAEKVHSEYVLAAKGKVRARPANMANAKIPTGEIEVLIDELKVLNVSKPLPFQVEDELEVGEAVRLKYRYLDLRRPSVQRPFLIRHQIAQAARRYLDGQNFVDLETPMLTKSTPEGARDYLVPSRMHPGEFYALPQSPQLFKQILMVAGFERYYQIVKCFRDEDLRADRQPEFTQIDIEMSFVVAADVMREVEGLLRAIVGNVRGENYKVEFPRMSYADAMAKYGCDKPDLRFGLELVELSDIFKGSSFKVFREVVDGKGIIKALPVKGGAKFSRKEIDDFTGFAQSLGAKGLAWIKANPDGWQSPILKFFSEQEKAELQKRTKLETGDIVFFAADKPGAVNQVLAALRLHVGETLGLIDKEKLCFLWVTDFPMFDYDEKEKRLVAMHHPFTSPRAEDLGKLESAPLEIKAQAYDIVLNGYEVGGGSVRIHDMALQSGVFKILGIGEEEARLKFGFLLEALELGAPPHGGVALGLDRLAMILSGATSLREVITFPKTQRGQCLMSGAPSVVDHRQLLELSLRVDKQA